MQSTAVTTTQEPQGLAALLRQPAYANRFKEVLGERAGQFVSSILSIGATMKDTDPVSIISSAMIAASLDLPINKNLGFAWIVPYIDKGTKRAQFQMGYKGFIQLALRTAQYSRMNVRAVNAEAFSGFDEVGEPSIAWDKIDESKEPVGYVFAWKLTNGFTKVCYWTRAKVEAHAQRYSQSYRKGYDSPWKTHFDEMAKKTLVKNELSRWGVLSIEFQNAVDADQAVDADGEAAYPDNGPVQGTKPPLDSKPIEAEIVPASTSQEPKPQPLPSEVKQASPNAEPPPKPKEKPAAPPSPPKPPKPAPPVAPPESVQTDDGDLGPQPNVTAQQALMQFLDASGVSWEDFRGWLFSSGRFLEAKSFATIDELPSDLCMKIGNDGAALAKCVRLYGTKAQETAKA